jgi:glyoxylase-like metal-dependent hydrolase (beta-lactamase superfamily II)
MRIINLTDPHSMIYSSNVYLILGDHSAIADVNTLIDVGNNPAIVKTIRNAPTGVGKPAIERVILTHGHFDHTALLPQIRAQFNPRVYAHPAFTDADIALQDGAELCCGDRSVEVIFTPGHSEDSICLYCEQEGALFVGDTPVIVRSDAGTHEKGFVDALARLCQKRVQAIYFGHGQPVLEDAQAVLLESLKNVRGAMGR